jgi:multicomponent Na+:H+ antiporter subunit E
LTGLFLLNVLLAVAWGFMSGSFSPANVIFGFVLSSFVLWLIREQFGTMGYLGRARKISSLLLLFLWELLLSAVRVAVTVVSPDMNLKPAFFSYPLTVDRDFEITVLASLITLTPGTLSVDVSNDRKTLYIHCLDASDLDATRADIAKGFERKIMEAFR